jgi:hypothetical protein
VAYVGLAVLPLASGFANEALATLFGVPNQIISQAANADKSGFTATGTNSRFYYTNAANPPNSGKLTLAPPTCYVVAVYRSAEEVSSSKQSWCNRQEMQTALGSSCGQDSPLKQQGMPLIAPTDPSASDNVAVTTSNLPSPDLYMEIGLDELAEVYGKPGTYKPPAPAAAKNASPAAAAPGASDSAVAAPASDVSAPSPASAAAVSIVRPHVMALYYPKSLLAKDSERKRSLSVTVTLAQVATYGANDNGNANLAPLLVRNKAAEAGLLNLSFTLNLNAEKPGDPAVAASETAYPQGWAVVPGLHQNIELSVPTGAVLSPTELALNLVPVNVTVSVHEVGDPSVFLAALNQATQTSGADFAKPLATALLPPPGTLSSAQTNDKNQASVNTLAAAYQKDMSAFAKECANPSVNNTRDGESTYLDSLWQIAAQDYQVVLQTAKAYDVAPGVDKMPLTRPNCGASKY